MSECKTADRVTKVTNKNMLKCWYLLFYLLSISMKKTSEEKYDRISLSDQDDKQKMATMQRHLKVMKSRGIR